MSMLVRKGAVLHRNSTRRHSRRNSTAVGRRERSASLVPSSTVTTTSSSVAGTSRSTSGDRRFSRVTIAAGPETASPSAAATRSFATAVAHSSSCVQKKKTGSTPSLTAPQNDSRRASSATSQMSSDDRRKLCKNKSRCYKDIEDDDLPSYGSFSYELQDARLEASGLCDFLGRVLEIVAKTALVTVLLLAFLTLALCMVVFGVQYVRDCPKEPNIPIYLLVGGCFGVLKAGTLLWRQSKCRRYERFDDSLSDEYEDFSTSTSAKVTEGALSLFLLVWLVFGTYWVFRIYKPRFEPLLFEPSNWCHKNLYVFALVQIYVSYSFIALFLFSIVLLAVLRKAGCL